MRSTAVSSLISVLINIASAPELVHSSACRAGFFIPAGNDEPRPFPGEDFRDSFADAFAAAGDNGDFTPQAIAHIRPDYENKSSLVIVKIRYSLS